MSEFALSALLPNIHALSDHQFSTPSGITAIFILATWFVFLCFAIWMIVVYFKARARYRFYIKLVDGVEQNSLAAKRRSLKREAREKERKSKWAELWNEFDETLAEVDGRIFNTVEASTFFNASTVARRLVGSRLLSAVPGILTGVGVLGTFLGLSLGLTHLTLAGGTEQMTSEIRELVSSASVAFTTSVWGVLASLVFNVTEKWIEGHVSKRISDLQRKIDELFDRFSLADIFVDIRSDSHEARVALQGLAEQIGDRMQIAMSRASESIQAGIESGLSNVLPSAVGRLVDAAEELNSREAKGSEDALRGVMEQYIAAIGAQGDSHRQALSDDSGEVRQALSTMATDMGALFATFKAQQAGFKAEQDERARVIEASALAAVNQQRAAIDYMKAIVDDQISAHKDLLEQGRIIAERVSRTHRNMDQATQRYGNAAENLLETVNLLKSASDGLKTTLESSSQHIASSADTATTMMRETMQVTENINRTMKVLDSAKRSIETTCNDLKLSAETARSGYETVSEHYESLQTHLQAHITDLEKEIARLLKEYSDHVRSQTIDRMSQWNKQTSEFSQTLVDAVQTVAALIDEIDTRMLRN